MSRGYDSKAIIKLKLEGKTCTQISQILGCSRMLVSYYCCPGLKERGYVRQNKYRQKAHPYEEKMKNFRSIIIRGRPIKGNKDGQQTLRTLIYWKLRNFLKKTGETVTMNIEEVIVKLTENPVCYLTGRPIDISKTRSYHFDHILPRSKGGKNTLDNLGIATKEANHAKYNLTVPEFIELCKDVLVNFGYDVKKTDT